MTMLASSKQQQKRQRIVLIDPEDDDDRIPLVEHTVEHNSLSLKANMERRVMEMEREVQSDKVSKTILINVSFLILVREQNTS